MIEEIITPAHTVYVEAKCPKCEDGKLVADGTTIKEYVLFYSHNCDKCGHREPHLDLQYPHTRVEKEEKRNNGYTT